MERILISVILVACVGCGRTQLDGAACGDQIVDTGREECDGADLGGATCRTLGYHAGELTCTWSCTLDTVGCSGRCGDGAANGPERCDGTDLRGESCQTQGFDGGSLACAADCSAFDTSQCVNNACGNGKQESPEACDGEDLGAETCISQGFSGGGALRCKPNCTFDLSGCTQDAGWSVSASGFAHSCAIKQSGTLWCWGHNHFGELGQGTSTDTHRPAQVGADSDWKSLAACGGDTYSHSCAIKANGALWCWGMNAYGQLGDGTNASRAKPVQVGTQTDWASVHAGWTYSCGIKQSGALWCWGDNKYGTLGDGTNAAQSKPKQIGAVSDWTAISAGSSHTCGLRKNGTLWCWGDNSSGKLGTGNTSSTNVPLHVDAGTTWTDVTAGAAYTCGIKTNGTLWCWGENFYGQLGIGPWSTATKHVPTQVQHVKNVAWRDVTGGPYHVCAITTGGTLYCWGWNLHGALGIGKSAQKVGLPAKVGQGWLSVTPWGYHSCGIKTDHSLWCWGSNQFGQAGSSVFADIYAPLQVAP